MNLGHAPLIKLKHLIPRLSQLNNSDCETCGLGKHVRVTFTSQVSI